MVLKILFGYLVTILGGSFFVSSMFRLVNFKEGKFSGIKYAGMLIGFFERFIILTLVLLNQYSAIAFIFTAKSIARFEELKKQGPL